MWRSRRTTAGDVLAQEAVLAPSAPFCCPAASAGGDQFCIYVHDFFVLPQLIASGPYEPKRGYLDRLTKQYIHEHLRYRFKVFQTEDSIQIVRHIETALKKGAFGFPPPFLNSSVG